MDELNNYLAHHQIKGGKWGVRRYQNYDGSLTEEGRRRYGVGPARGSKESLKDKINASREKKKAEKEVNREKNAQDAYEQQKTKLRQSIINNPKKIVKYNKAFSKEEVKDIISEIEWNKKMYDIKRSETQRRMQKVKDLSDGIGTFSNLMNNSINAWNNAAAINNALVSNGTFKNGKIMPKVGWKDNNNKNNNNNNNDN